jgi:epoxyqueuosine reductase
MLSMTLSERIKSRAMELGFDLVGFAPAGVAPHAKAYADWIAAGYAGELAYMTRDPDRRSDLQRVLPGAQSVIVAGLSYYTVDLPDAIKNDPSRGLISRYAWGVDYHGLMTPRLKELAEFVEGQAPHPPTPSPDLKNTNQERGSSHSPLLKTSSPFSGEGPGVRHKVYVDTGQVLERDWALSAGLGFIGKNTCLINPRMGSWLFLGVIITTAELEIDRPPLRSQASPDAGSKSFASPDANSAHAIGCGTCTRCLVACPTNAFPQPYVLDARRCISYLTIELKGSIPLELRPLMGNHIFGCDICQDVCPWPTRFATPTKERAFFAAELDRAAPRLIELASLSEGAFKQKFAGTPILRSKRRGLLRNVAVALGNWGSIEAKKALRVLAADPDPIIAEHAQWGLSH